VKICRQDWEQVIEKACDIANAAKDEDDPMYEVHVESMMRLLDELEATYGPQSRILATRADYVESSSERRALYVQALDLAGRRRMWTRSKKRLSIPSISLVRKHRPNASPNGGPVTRSGNSEVGGGPPSV
jgi:hypothetical protein